MTSPIEAGARAELLPCPFCGKQPQSRWYGATGEDDDSGYWGIDCCQAFSHAGAQDDAVDNWNRRPAAIASGALVPASQLAAERERCCELIRSWTSHSKMQLHAGEMTAQEKRTTEAILNAIERQIRALETPNGRAGT